MVQQHLLAGGKHVRARLALAAMDALGPSRDDGIAWAAAVEALHNATLVHDDIQDGDLLRRGEPTVWVRHGVPQAINAGDLLLMMPILHLQEVETSDEIRWALAFAIARRAAATVRGQAQEMALVASERLDWKAYLQAVEGKTGHLLALPIEGALLLAGRPAERARTVGDAFLRLGVLFQLQDDLRDLFAEKGRGERGSDLREGKPNALCVAHLELHPGDRQWLFGLLHTPRHLTTDAAVEEATRRFERDGALDAVLARIETEGEAVRTSACLAQEPRIHEIAMELASWIGERVHGTDPTP
jgi:geranylgeranyl diphosphate synthase type I